MSLSASGSPSRDVVIWNPRSGKGRGAARFAALRAQLGKDDALWETSAPGAAETLARQAAEEGYQRVFAIGGDGTVHEVVNGLLSANAPTPALVVVPVGSANDYAHSVRFEARAAGRSPLDLQPVDVGQISSTSGRRRFFVDGVGIGLNGMVTEESRRIHRLQGVLLYGLATARALWKLDRAPEMAVQLNGGVPLVGPTMLLSVLLAQREGNFLIAPQARLGDGWFNVVHAALTSRWEALRLLPRIALWGLPQVYPGLTRSLCQSVRVSAPQPLVAHADGELFCVPADGVTELDIEILPGRLQVALWEG